MNLLVIKDDKPGHYNQTEGLILQLREIYSEINVEYIDIKIKSKISRKILRFVLNNFDSFFQKKENLKYLSFFYKNFSIPSNIPDLILSTGGNTSNLNAWFAKVYSCKNILNGALRGLKEELFTYITTVIDLGYKNQVILDVAPSLITQEKIKESSKKFIQEKKLDANNTYYSLLIGGNGSGYIYNDEFYDSLITFVKVISNKKDIKWLITTSRRTPSEIENKLENELKDFSSYFVSYNQKEEKILTSYLGLSEKVFVTEDSASMISESISSYKPVYTLGLNKFNKDGNYQQILEKFETNKFLIRIKNFDENFQDFQPNFKLNTNLNIVLKEVCNEL